MPPNNRAGTPDPLDFRYHRPVGGVFAEGAAIPAAPDVVIIVPIAGALQYRLRGKFTCAGTLSFAYLRPPPKDATAYDVALDPPSADVAVVADTEFLVDIQPSGESQLRITFNATGAGVVTFLDQMQQ